MLRSSRTRASDPSWLLIERHLSEGRHEIELAAPDRLYLTDEQSRAYEAATSENPTYRSNIETPIMSLIRKNCKYIFSDLDKSIYFIDLGPGYPVKSVAIIDFVLSIRLPITYFAVDVSRFFLDRAVAAVSQRGVHSIAIERRFEELEQILDTNLSPDCLRVIFLGLTFCNFELDSICRILSALLREGDICLVCTQTLRGTGEAELAPYRDSKTISFAFGFLKNIGLKIDDFIFEPRVIDHCIQTTFVSNKNIRRNRLHIPRGTRFITAKSYRRPLAAVVKALNVSMKHVRSFTDPGSGMSLLQVTGRRFPSASDVWV